MSIKTGLLFFLTFCSITTPISGIIDDYRVMENYKKNWKVSLLTLWLRISTQKRINGKYNNCSLEIH